MQDQFENHWPGTINKNIRSRFISANNLEFEVAEYGPQDSEKLAICLHGFPELNYSWRFQIPLLARRGWRVWAPNLRGYGNSSRPTGIRSYALDHLTNDVAALIDAAKAEYPAKKTMLVAHDWGAVIAWHFAAMRLRPIDRLVIMNVPHPDIGRRELFKWRQLWKSWYIFFFQFPKLPELFLTGRGAKRIKNLFLNMANDLDNFDEETVQHFADAALDKGAATAMVNYYRALFRYRDTVDIGSGKIDTPTLMIWGEDDTALNINCTVGTDELVPDLTFKSVPGVSHWVQQEAPGKVNKILDRWLDERADSPPIQRNIRGA